MKNNSRLIIGAIEHIGLPDMGIRSLKARVDTGAKTSSLHASTITEFERDGEAWVAFKVHIGDTDKSTEVDCEAMLVGKRMVRSSNGEKEVRHVIRTTICLGERDWSVELTLTSREKMRFRMLLGRAAMVDRVLVDPAHAYVAGKPKCGKAKAENEKSENL